MFVGNFYLIELIVSLLFAVIKKNWPPEDIKGPAFHYEECGLFLRLNFL